jgi:2-polyprenyl-3-methyl-5-hydroxy-6-metoxy-1,4-benzoquinol methylase
MFDTAERFDAITWFEVIEHLREPEPVIARIAALLKRGGLLCMSRPNNMFWGWHSGNPHHIREFSAVELAALLRLHFR